jgi:hypothetical protein
MEAASARVRIGTRAGSRPVEAAIEARSAAAYAAEGIGTFLLVFFIYRALVLARQPNTTPMEVSR